MKIFKDKLLFHGGKNLLLYTHCVAHLNVGCLFCYGDGTYYM